MALIVGLHPLALRCVTWSVQRGSVASSVMAVLLVLPAPECVSTSLPFAVPFHMLRHFLPCPIMLLMFHTAPVRFMLACCSSSSITAMAQGSDFVAYRCVLP